MFRVLCVMLVAFLIGGATHRPADVGEARAAFKALPLQERLDIQSLLTVTGYWPVVANDAFGPKLMGAIQAFQSDAGFPATGILTAEQGRALREMASPLLRMWGLAPVRHPSASATLWVPKGLNLSMERDGGDLEFEAASETLFITFVSAAHAELEPAFRAVKGDLLKQQTLKLEYEVLKDDFFVVATAGDGVSAYTRFQRLGSGIVGFTMVWKTESELHGDRLVVLISDLFRSSVGQKQSRQPPSPVQGTVAADSMRFIVIASRPEAYEAIQEAREHHVRLSKLAVEVGAGRSFDNLFVARFANGRYAVVIGPVDGSKVTEMRDLFKGEGLIPEDSFVSDGSKLLEIVWTPPKEGRKPAVSAAATAPSKPKDVEISTGTGFYVAPKTILTNAHVVEGCTSVTVSLNRSPSPAKVMARDEANDLALVSAGEESAKTAAFRGGVKLGEDIAAFGFPLSEQLASSGNFTRGNITATAGLHDDSRHVQFSAPIQPGNSGGPLLDESGNVVGVIFSKLRDTRTADGSGDVHQNVNFAIKSAMVLSFLESNGVTPQIGTTGEALRAVDLAARAQEFTVAIRCEAQP